MTAPVPAKTHARLSASSAHRWVPCPGSVALAAQYPNVTSFPAAEGTFAHHIAEVCLREGRDPEAWLGNKTIIEGHTVECDGEMVEGVRAYCNYVRGIPGERFVELDITAALQRIHPDLGGTSDVVILDRAARRLDVIDLKYGAGVRVDPEDNLQFDMYGIGVLASLVQSATAWTGQIDAVRLIVVQPRIEVDGQVVRIHTVTPAKLMAQLVDVVEAADATRDPNAPLHATQEGCRWCPAAAHCPELKRMQDDFIEGTFEVVSSTAHPLGPEGYDPFVLAEALQRISMVEERIKALREFAYAEAMAGRVPPGHKLVAKRATRKWADADKVKAIAAPEWYEAPALRSPAQLEKLLGKKAFGPIASEHVTQQSSGYTLVAESDARAPVALPSAAEMFEALPSAGASSESDPASLFS